MKKLYEVELNSKGMPNFSTAQEVPQRIGRWIHQAKFGRIECDQCGKVYRNAFVPKNYCPNCGARMEGEV